MTPEERAQQLLDEFGDLREVMPLRDAIVEAIKEAVEEAYFLSGQRLARNAMDVRAHEREAILRLIDEDFWKPDASSEIMEMTLRIREAIRGRK